MHKWILVLIVFTSLGCGSAFKKLMYGGKVKQVNFYQEIDFDFSTGLPLIKVSIQGQEYTFLLDSGAPNVLSAELAEKIDYKVVTSADINDSQGNREKQVSVKIDNIRIGDLDFVDMGAIIIDYNKVFEMTCFKFDGIIGANLMSKAIWQIDYEESKIIISDSIESFDVADDAFSIPFITTNSQRTPKVKIKTDRVTFNKVTFDTGAVGAFGMGMGKAKPIIDSLEGFEIEGATSTGVYGPAKVTVSKVAKIDSIKMGDLVLLDQVIEFESTGSTTLGNSFLKEYRVLINWKASEIKLEKRAGYDKKEYRGFDVLPRIKDNKMLVTAIVKGSDSEAMGVKVGSQIVSVNGQEVTYISDGMGCEYVINKPLRTMDTLNLKIDQEGTLIHLSLPKHTYISE